MSPGSLLVTVFLGFRFVLRLQKEPVSRMDRLKSCGSSFEYPRSGICQGKSQKHVGSHGFLRGGGYWQTSGYVQGRECSSQLLPVISSVALSEGM